jgi:hypothetical protein
MMGAGGGEGKGEWGRVPARRETAKGRYRAELGRALAHVCTRAESAECRDYECTQERSLEREIRIEEWE